MIERSFRRHDVDGLLCPPGVTDEFVVEELVFPHDAEVCLAARAAGLRGLNWYLGNLMPVLDVVRRLPLDALVLEQGRKAYATDPVEIRRRVGPRFCLFGFGHEHDYCADRREPRGG